MSLEIAEGSDVRIARPYISLGIHERVQEWATE